MISFRNCRLVADTWCQRYSITRTIAAALACTDAKAQSVRVVTAPLERGLCLIRVLLAASPEIGVLVAGASPDLAACDRRYGAVLGRAFQLQDDILGIWGDEAATGKWVASHILSKKKSLPVIYGLAHEGLGPDLSALYVGPGFRSLRCVRRVPTRCCWRPFVCRGAGAGSHR